MSLTQQTTTEPSARPLVVNLYDIYKYQNDWDALYRLLEERDDPKINISHRTMPKYCEHLSFVQSKPYEAWYFIVIDNADPPIGCSTVGAIYLTKRNEIGIHLFKQYRGMGYGRRAIAKLMSMHGKRRYLANINPKNDPSRALFVSLGFKAIQHTYELQS